jgi:transcriptional regulator with XRE-family HTH domain
MEVINGAELALLLKKKGIKQKDLCEKLDIDQSLVSKYYHDVHVMPAPFLLKVAKLAGLQMSDLIKDEPSGIIASEPMVMYERTPKKESRTNHVVDGLAIGEYIMMIEKRLIDVEQSLKEMQKKSSRVMEMATM